MDKKKGEYTQLQTTDEADVDFKATLQKSKDAKGTYAILPQEELDFETEYAAMEARGRTINSQPTQEWPAMQQFKTQNEKSIRKSIVRTDQAEREQRIKDGLATPTRPPKPPKPPRTPKQQLIYNRFGEIITKSQAKQKENAYETILQEAEPLIFQREIKRAKKIVDEKVGNYSKQIAELDKERAVLERRKAELNQL